MVDQSKVSALEARIAQLETSLRQVPTGGSRPGDLAAFSAGSCTNNCTAACTIGCTKGCTDGCAAAPVEMEAIRPQLDLQGVMADAFMFFEKAAGRG